MREIVGNIFSQECDAICITTNGVIKPHPTNSEWCIGTMGAGIAKQAAIKYPALPHELGAAIMDHGHNTQIIHGPYLSNYSAPWTIVSFPTKLHWKQNSPLWLVKQSAGQLFELANSWNWHNIVLTRPGCGLGRLKWSEVKPAIAEFLDDRFAVITP